MKLKLLVICILLGGCNNSELPLVQNNMMYFLLKSDCKKRALEYAEKHQFSLEFGKVAYGHSLFENIDTLGILKYEYHGEALDFVLQISNDCFGNTFATIPEGQLLETNMHMILNQGKSIEGLKYNNGNIEVYLQEYNKKEEKSDKRGG